MITISEFNFNDIMESSSVLKFFIDIQQMLTNVREDVFASRGVSTSRDHSVVTAMQVITNKAITVPLAPKDNTETLKTLWSLVTCALMV